MTVKELEESLGPLCGMGYQRALSLVGPGKISRRLTRDTTLRVSLAGALVSLDGKPLVYIPNPCGSGEPAWTLWAQGRRDRRARKRISAIAPCRVEGAGGGWDWMVLSRTGHAWFFVDGMTVDSTGNPANIADYYALLRLRAAERREEG